MIILNAEIPLSPPSVNTYWSSNGKRRFVSERGVKFKKDMAAYIPYLMTDKRLKCELVLNMPTKRRFDIDNFTKVIFDSLVQNGLCLDDEQFDELIVKRGKVIKGGLIKITVTELN